MGFIRIYSFLMKKEDLKSIDLSPSHNNQIILLFKDNSSRIIQFPNLDVKNNTIEKIFNILDMKDESTDYFMEINTNNNLVQNIQSNEPLINSSIYINTDQIVMNTNPLQTSSTGYLSTLSTYRSQTF